MVRLLALLAVVTASSLHAQSLSVLYSFANDTQAKNPGYLIQGADGNFYGQTNGDQIHPSTVFQFTPAGSLTTLLSTQAIAVLRSIVYAKNGSLYGTTVNDGQCAAVQASHLHYGCGTVFQLTPQGVESILYEFQDMTDGFDPSNLVSGADGNFYGLTSGGFLQDKTGSAPLSMGTVFKITPGGTLTTLFTFSGPNGNYPNALIQGANGNLYGTTRYGGTGPCTLPPETGYPEEDGCGAVFEITPGGALTVLYSFQGADDGSDPEIFVPGADGNFYGVTFGSNSSNSYGTFFKITPSGTFTTLFNFAGTQARPQALTAAANGNFYGITIYGGSGNCFPGTSKNPGGCGTIFELTPGGALSTVFNLDGALIDDDVSSLMQGLDGNLYGTCALCGENGPGLVFEFAFPSPNAPAIASSNGVLNGASFQPGISPGSWITISGTNLATKPDSWTIVNGALPTTLDGVSVLVGGQPAYIEYISSTQINALAPNVPSGSVPVVVTNSNGASLAVNAQLSAEMPAFFQWGSYAVATHQDYSYAVKNGTLAGTTTVPAAPGDVIILWGTGFGPASPAVPNGMETPSTGTYNTATPVGVSIGGKMATVYGAALAPGYAGLYQIAIQIPAGLSGGDYPVVATVNGVSSPAEVMITVQQ